MALKVLFCLLESIIMSYTEGTWDASEDIADCIVMKDENAVISLDMLHVSSVHLFSLVYIFTTKNDVLQVWI